MTPEEERDGGQAVSPPKTGLTTPVEDPKENELSFKDRVRIFNDGAKASRGDFSGAIKDTAEDPDLLRKTAAFGIDKGVALKPLVENAEEIPVLGDAISTINPQHWRVTDKDERNTPQDAGGVQRGGAFQPLPQQTTSQPVPAVNPLQVERENRAAEQARYQSGFDTQNPSMVRPEPQYNDFASSANKRVQDEPPRNTTKATAGATSGAQVAKDPSKVASQIGNAASQKLGGQETAMGRTTQKMGSKAEDAINAARIATGDYRAALSMAKKYKEPLKKVLIGFAILFMVFVLLVVMAMGSTRVELGNSGSVVAGNPGGSISTLDELDGLKIPFPDTKIGDEAHFCDGAISGKHYDGPGAEPLRSATEPCEGARGDGPHSTNSGGPAYGSVTPEEERWYFTGPWAYQQTWPAGTEEVSNIVNIQNNVLGNKVSCVGSGMAKKWKGKKVVVTNIATQKSVVASIQECGPNMTVVKRDGIGAGAPPDVLNALGIEPKNHGAAYTATGMSSAGTPNDSVNRVHIAFAADQGVKLGPVTVSADTSGFNTSAALKLPAGSVVLDVPFYKQTLDGSCDNVANYQVALYYAKKYGGDANKITKPERTDQGAGVCSILTASIRQAGFTQGKDFVARKREDRLANNSETWNMIFTAVSQGDPVVMRTNVLSSGGGQHWVVVLGYSADKKTAYYNDLYSAEVKSKPITDANWYPSRAYGRGPGINIVSVKWLRK